MGFFYLPSFFTTNITNVAIFITAPFDIFQQSLPLTFVTILKNICFQIKNLIERYQSIFDRHETIAYTLNGMKTEQLQICNSSKCHLHTKVNKIYRLIHQIFSLEFTITEMHVQYAYLTFISTFKFLSSSFTKTKTVTRLCQPKTGEHIKFTTG